MEIEPCDPNPWTGAEARYQPGQEVRGTVTRVTQFGVFVQIEPGIAGVIYAFELGQGPSTLASLSPGEEMRLYVKSVDARKKRLELSPGNQAMPGLTEGSALPAVVRQNRKPDEPAWPELSTLLQAQVGPEARICPTCQRPGQGTWKYCVYCGGSLRRHCPACSSVQPDLPGAKYCCECGKPL